MTSLPPMAVGASAVNIAMRLEDAILDHALALGFSAAGFAAAGPAASADCLDAWLASGRAAGMDYLRRHAPLRKHPACLLPEVRSLVAVGLRYRPMASNDGYAGYALCPDYHDFMRERLRQLAAAIQELMGVAVRFRICVDSAPLPEREWAVRAGLGWLGRQGALVHPRWGCGLLPGFILLDRELAASPAVTDQCVACQRCTAACPNAAIGADGLLDARRCSAYWTVEHRGIIPAAAAPLVGERLFGCDCCTAICPMNPADFCGDGLPRIMDDAPGPEACLALDQASFRARFGGTPVMRLGLERLQRNALVVLYNRGRRPVLETTVARLAHEQMEALHAIV